MLRVTVQVRIEAVGFFVFLVYPGAFVELNTEQVWVEAVIFGLDFDPNHS